ncbi:MAG TPA: ATPase, T2SS/T4P/T4SS family, partial [Phycisphaerae bacterium]|nr:ATPase, T2SS/T4P/T4SS family [Phycisphaerae bacterium]
GGTEIKFRIDGLLTTIEQLPADAGRAVVLRLMVMGQLLTYRLDIPQEGRIRTTFHDSDALARIPARQEVDLRLAVIPTAHGLRAAVRLPAELTQPRNLADLGLPPLCLERLQQFARTDAGMLLVTGPAGSGKTTTIYALLEYIAHTSPGVSIISLEDPIERLVNGVTQIEVAPHGQLTYDRALKSILRQDPQVLMLGEIRDAATAALAVQAALSGHRLIATMHAGEPATALARLMEMDVAPYQISSSLFGILTLRLLRRRTPEGYKGRIPAAEFGLMDEQVRSAVLARADAGMLRKSFSSQPGHATLKAVAGHYVTQNLTDIAEVQRVLGD